jgi:hypothetical protein
MNIGNIGKALASQALESTKSAVLDPPKPAEAPAPGPVDIGAVILAQIQAMQRSIKEEQELLVQLQAAGELLRVREIFVPTNQVLVFAGTDQYGNTMRIITPAAAVQVVCKIVKIPAGTTPVRVNILTPKPQPKPAA